MFLVQLVVLVFSIYFGTKYKGLSLGVISALGLALLVFLCRIVPEKPPIDVPVVILSMVTAAGALEASGGLGYFIRIAEKAMRRYPKRITMLSPMIVYLITFISGTGHTIYSILPVIATVSRDVGVRPERPLSVSVIAAQQAAISSPISVPTVVALSILGPLGVSLPTLLKIMIPSTLFGTIAASLLMMKKGKDLCGIYKPADEQASHENLSANPRNDSSARKAAIIFLLGIALVMVAGFVEELRPKDLNMTQCIVLAMLATAGMILLFCKISTKAIMEAKTFTTGVQAAISILGLSWLGSTFVKSNEILILDTVQGSIAKFPWMFGLLLFVVCIPLMSQSNTIRLLLPLGLAMGIKLPILLASLPAVNSVFFLPSYPTITAAIELDSTGSTRIGRYVLNHSFMLPGLVATATSSLVAYLIVMQLF